MFPWFGVLKSAKDEMSLMANARFELYRDARLQVYYDVERTWYELFKIQKDLSISEKNIEILQTIERLAIAKFRAPPSSGTGMSGLSDLYRIQIETGELQNNIESLKSQYSLIAARFNSYLNRQPASPVFVSDSVPMDTIGMPLVSVQDSILANNPMLSMLKFEEQSIEARKNMVKNMGYPMVGLGLNYSLISKNEMSVSPMNGKDMIMPMVSVTLPVYRNKYRTMIAEAEFLKAAASNNYSTVTNTLHTEYYQAVQLYSDAKRRIRLYNNQFMLASKSLKLMLKSYTASLSSLTDLLRVRQQVLDYELKQTEALADLNTATALLKRLMASSQIN
jgi:outer membrane protein TolC